MLAGVQLHSRLIWGRIHFLTHDFVDCIQFLVVVGRRASGFCWPLTGGYPQLLDATHSSLACGPLHGQPEYGCLLLQSHQRRKSIRTNLIVNGMRVAIPHFWHILFIKSKLQDLPTLKERGLCKPRNIRNYESQRV